MKVGILTYHWVSNFGANLQALSTYRYLINNGYEPVIINWVPEDLEVMYSKNVLTCQNEIHKQFANEFFQNITKVCRNGEDIASEIEREGISKVLIGSDAVFTNLPKLARYRVCRKGFLYIKPKSDCDFPNPFWGNFLSHLSYPVVIVAISASAQNMPYRKILFSKEKNGYRNALMKFSNITVRDIWTQNMIKFITSGKIVPEISPDPVFAFEQNVRPEKMDYVHKRLGIGGKYVLFSAWSSIKDVNWIRGLEALFEREGYSVVGLPKTTMKVFQSPLKFNLSFPISPMEWYDAIKYSDGYIGELMHPILVALHNSVPVFSFDTYGFTRFMRLDVKSSKIYHILNRFNLLDNYYNRHYNKSLPSPKDVFDRITCFDRKSCGYVSEQMLNEYNKMMSKSISI